MKKIIAAAVATAFVAPVMAADVTVGGSMIYNYVTTNKAVTDDKVANDDTQVNVTATQELANGMTVTGKINIVNDDPKEQDVDMQGSSLTVAGAFGKIAIGDVSGALDATGDWTDVSPVFGGYDADGEDSALSYTLPSLAEGLTVVVSTAPKGANATGDGNFDTEGLGHNSYSLTYAMGPVSVYGGNETYMTVLGEETDRDSYGLRYSSGPIMLAYEAASASNITIAAGGLVAHTTEIDNKKVDYTGIAGTYTMGDSKLGFEMQKIEEVGTGNTTRQDETTLFVSHNLGGGVSVYAATSEDKGGPADTAISSQAVGVAFSF